ncbi:uncharacterized protein [Dermacentor andersoni]|uniref:uncharacterized protein n=1 Tax=Dermacentor andersoni TaxID=34620 RepID=UPI0024171B7B|nr:uncharacterized protein LOC129380221 [Dermacentor andersoni]
MLAGTTALRRLPKLPKSVRDVGGAVKQQRIDPHMEHKIDLLLDMAPSPYEEELDTGYNGTGISGNPSSIDAALMQIKCGDCSCGLPVRMEQYGRAMGCTQAVKKLICSCPPRVCYMNHIAKCLQMWATGKCKSQHLFVTCP